MHVPALLFPLLASLALARQSQSQLSNNPSANTSNPDLGKNLNITVIGARNNRSTLECWAVEPGWESSTQKGEVGSSHVNLGQIGGSAGNASYSVLPAHFDGGRHNAPAAQYVIILQGMAHVTLPDSDAEAFVPSGRALLALDTPDVSALGHITRYPAERTVALQIPLGAGGVPKHRVLHQGGCSKAEHVV
ncbi:hypothetical protein N7492_003011 [Penicillium capsulatum]|uniref:Cupin type-1 domain-containing protein n=1 Tax=Penicillium capsulatum TaxID=69766 RepID=A0A9W9LVP8_9EURO|nr:hypothetical protein N7492_003011 [Penicillium capsulatum]KAJ6122398.1 hypothetical protein N7512_004863 [Penicillium capsulatum]